MIWARMRRDIEMARALLLEREQAITACEEAHARLRELYDMPSKGKRAAAVHPDLPPEATPPAGEALRRPEGHVQAAVGAAHGNGAAAASMGKARTCPTCSAVFTPTSGRQKYCDAHLTTNKYKPAPGRAGEPLPEKQCRYCQEVFVPTSEAERHCSRLCKSLSREDRYAREHAEAQSPVPT